MTGSVNWGEVIQEAREGGGSFEPIPAGDYDLLVTNPTHKVSQGGKMMYVIEATVQGGPYNGRKIWDNLVVSPDSGTAMGYFFKKMKAIGLPTEYFQGGPSDDQIVNDLRNRSFRAKVGIKTFNSKDSNSIVEYYPSAAAPGGPVPATPVAAAAPMQAAPAPAPAPAAAAPQYAAPAPQAAPQPAAPPAAAPPAAAPQAAPVASPWDASTPAPPPPTPF